MSHSSPEPEITTNEAKEFSINVSGTAEQMKKPKKRGNPNYAKWKKRKIDPSTFVCDQEMANLKIPTFLQHAYLSGLPSPKITKFREWQANLFARSDWQEGKNAIVVVPTSGGKTVAADVAIAQAIDGNKHAKAILALPFVALANEKHSEYVSRFFNQNVRAFYMNIGGPDFHQGHIAVCTYEKAHSLLNSALTSGYANRIKIVVIDEVHMIGDENRGPVIEALIVKLMLMKHKPRIVGLTATVNESDAIRLARWINGFEFITQNRPSQIRQFYKGADGSLSRITDNQELRPFIKLKSIPEDNNHLLDPIRTYLSREPSTLMIIFVNTRAETHQIAELLAVKLYDNTIDLPKLKPPPPDIVTARSKLIEKLYSVTGVVDKQIANCIAVGIGVHHAGLLMEERKLIEDAARNKTLCLLVATTTLSAGVNISNVSRVFIMNIYRWTPRGNILIPAAQFTQMIGRAGRTEKRPGEAFIIAHTNNENEKTDILNYSKHIIPDIIPHLADEGHVDRFYLQCLSTKLISPKDGLVTFLSQSLSGVKDIESVSKRLVELKLVDERNLEATPLGRAIAGSSLSIEEGMELELIVKKIQRSLCFDDECHLLYICIPSSLASTLKKESYDSRNWNEIILNHMHIIKLITGLNEREIEHLQDLPHIYGGNGRINPVVDSDLDRVYAAVILYDLINEVPLAIIQKKYKVDRGFIQNLQMQSASYAGQASRFCELYGAVLLSTTLNRFRQRLNFAARSELLSLMVLPACNKIIARKLYDCGITSPVEISVLNTDALASLLTPIDDKGFHMPPTENEIQIATNILSQAQQYTKSIQKIEKLEEIAVQNLLDE